MQNRKPVQVRIAVGLFYLSLALSLVKPFIELGPTLRPPVSLVLTVSIAALVTVFLIEFISIGRNWARIAYLVLTLLSLPFTVYALARGLTGSYIGTGSVIVQLLLHAVGLYLLFATSGKRWFAPRR
ncbi:hypothetical protein [Lysobacter firmicutimachus]|uniref:Uncharacterized protein n=1 Tax=Lysobacter firmicutimachus TaxID=1792846 RepID=A0ABU8CXH6_9GAMM